MENKIDPKTNNAAFNDRLDLNIIADLIDHGSRVLDIGCGDGDLLSLLKKQKSVKAYGIEIVDEMIVNCIAKGLTVFQGDIDEGLSDCNSQSFDYVILSQTLQVLRHPDFVIKEILRVGKKAIVTFPNFGYWKCRLSLLLSGKAPRTSNLPFAWYNTPNRTVITIRDFMDYCRDNHIKIIREIPLRIDHTEGRIINFLPNLGAHYGIFVISKG